MAKYNEKYPWDQIRDEYVVGYFVTDPDTMRKRHWYPTYKDIHEKYGINLDYLRKRALRESWTTRRDALQAKLREKTAANTLHSFISDSAQFDALTIIAMKKLYRLIEAYFDQYDILESNEDGTISIRDLTEEQRAELPDIRVHDLKNLVDTLDKAQVLVRRTVGEPLHSVPEGVSILADEILNPDVTPLTKEGKSEAEARIDKLIQQRENNQKSIEELKQTLKEMYESAL